MCQRAMVAGMGPGMGSTAAAVGLLLVVISTTGEALSVPPCSYSSRTCYTVHETEVTWMEAEYACDSQAGGGGLATLFPVDPDVDYRGSGSYWIQTAVTVQNGSSWEWLSGQEMEFPPGASSAERRCAVLTVSTVTGLMEPMEWAPCAHSTQGALCKTKHPVNCKLTNTGSEYAGSEDHAATGEKCLSWSKKGNIRSDWKFPDYSLEAAGSSCRNPDGDLNGPFCFKEDEPSSYGYCTQIGHCSSPRLSDEQDGGCSSRELTSDDVTCVAGQCYVFLPRSKFGNKTWAEALQCCARHEGTLLDSLPVPQLLEKVIGMEANAGSDVITLWVGATDHEWTWMLRDHTDVTKGFICPAISTSGDVNPVPRLDDCTLKRPYICQRENPDFGKTMPPTTTTTTTTTTTPGSGGKSGEDGDSGEGKGPNSERSTEEESDDDGSGFMYMGIGIGVGVFILVIVVIILLVYLVNTKRQTDRIKERIVESPPASPTSSEQIFINNGFTPGTAQPHSPATNGVTSNGISAVTQPEDIYSTVW